MLWKALVCCIGMLGSVTLRVIVKSVFMMIVIRLGVIMLIAV
jgi:hypothetical protein